MNAYDCDNRGFEWTMSSNDLYFPPRDRRGGKLLGCYSESHEDDITQVNILFVIAYSGQIKPQ